ncbi:D-ribose pyranase [Pokkaliibacter sp. CJK22405]|uniref:D-ribose pyranase n=1 Tax=Pokkaliibacter sp. CJK22405 TaxID=3384615 RepID=UPI003984A817
MRLATLLNHPLTDVLARLGHTDEITVGDAGLPVPNGVPRIDLAVSRGIPQLQQVLRPMLEETAFEAVILAEEIREHSPEMHEQLCALINSVAATRGIDISLSYVPHEQFKSRSANSKAVVRTGECTPYANIILIAGVAF